MKIAHKFVIVLDVVFVFVFLFDSFFICLRVRCWALFPLLNLLKFIRHSFTFMCGLYFSHDIQWIYCDHGVLYTFFVGFLLFPFYSFHWNWNWSSSISNNKNMKGKSCINIKITFIVSNPDEIYIVNRAVITHVCIRKDFCRDLLLYAGRATLGALFFSLTAKNNT